MIWIISIGSIAALIALIIFLMVSPWKAGCWVGLHRWTKGSPWREGWYIVQACDRCGPKGGWREFWRPHRNAPAGTMTHAEDWSPGGRRVRVIPGR